jgi:hypothetical protein
MRKYQYPTPIRLEALFARVGFWLRWIIFVVSRIGALNGSRRLRAFVARTERTVEGLLFLAATERLRPSPPRTRRPAGTRAGYRRVRSGGNRLMLRYARIRARGTLAKRLAAILRAFEHPERIVARIVKRLRAGLTGSRLVLAAPVADAVFRRAIAPPTADSS